MAISSKTISNFLYHKFPQLFWRPYSRKLALTGIDELLVVLSYDSDTDEDAKAAVKLFGKLEKLEIPATFAVPGSQLVSGAKEYKMLHKAGAHFINHGGAAHTVSREGRYWSTNFYNSISQKEVIEDIKEGHKIFTDTFSEEAKGFRAPHFGHFQSVENLSLIYSVLNELGSYQFSSTTLSRWTLTNAPIFKKDSILEIPIIGTYDWPTRIFDSWGHVQDKKERKVDEMYGINLGTTLRAMRRRKIPAILNYYADPSHIIESKSYFEALRRAKSEGIKFVDFEYIIDRFTEQSSEWK